MKVCACYPQKAAILPSAFKKNSPKATAQVNFLYGYVTCKAPTRQIRFHCTPHFSLLTLL
ncbi:hypothetical protein ERICIV_03985 [Paenibacillus larvae subsp. larvae]|uniref:Uncharacterized protein n=1 Tax=Paenibacillus larvae subsp. larvae TaxID=147375 RepID=A0A2L1U5V9_9BACL|nr:hypothetical protein ERICIII_04242 [Paenibacillus larvae subsp. larvae]AVF32809.1 hypothetical protein ERICIV_03985 [Paenibacillus larvae subsp. larvae]